MVTREGGNAFAGDFSGISRSVEERLQEMDIRETFGLHWIPFFSQVIIILIVFVILKKFAFGPVLAMLEERKARIEDGIKNLEKIKNDLEAAEARAQELIDKANEKAERMVGDAQESAAALAARGRADAANEANQIIEKAREAARLDQERMTAELKRDFGRLVIETTSKVTGKVLTAEDQDRINRETAGQVSL